MKKKLLLNVQYAVRFIYLKLYLKNYFNLLYYLLQVHKNTVLQIDICFHQ